MEDKELWVDKLPEEKTEETITNLKELLVEWGLLKYKLLDREILIRSLRRDIKVLSLCFIGIIICSTLILKLETDSKNRRNAPN